MCTLIASFSQHPGFPVVVAANRDEVRSRPASGPRPWDGEAFVAPKDELSGGSWLGLNRNGVFVAITNRYPATKVDGRESRGTLVVEALRHVSAEAVHASLARLPTSRFNPFHLLYADARHAFVTWSDGEVVRQQELAPGLHIVTERSLGGDDHARASLIHAAWPEVARDGQLPTPEALERLLGRTRPDDPVGGVCVDVPGLDYGTRSSLVLFRADRLADSRWFWAEGPPDRTPFVERADLIGALAG